MKKITIKGILQIIFFLPIIIPCFIAGWCMYYVGWVKEQRRKQHERTTVQN